ncbi:uncharacterized protein LOC116434586 isoform X3 [Nomia melanderi]|uniref:uncharacterized protein LOC116434586 isoform X3 n=1 Tax=Nomia melanderi TaxID=2448451 RepID=UPI00130436B8|nr:uncharacterized protein LOC116434586 isoform X3 [Nomia melanderi]
MRLLFALAVIEFFSYIFPKNSENEVQFKKLQLFKSTGDMSNYTNKSFYNNQEQNFVAKFNSNIQCRGSNERKIQYDYYRSLYNNPYSSVANIKMHKYVQINEIELQQYTNKLSILRSQQHFGYFEGSKNYGRKLLNSLDETDYRDLIKTNLFHEIKGVSKYREDI